MTGRPAHGRCCRTHRGIEYAAAAVERGVGEVRQSGGEAPSRGAVEVIERAVADPLDPLRDEDPAVGIRDDRRTGGADADDGVAVERGREKDDVRRLHGVAGGNDGGLAVRNGIVPAA